MISRSGPLAVLCLVMAFLWGQRCVGAELALRPQEIECFVLVTFAWPQFEGAVHEAAQRRSEGWTRMSRIIGELLKEAFESGDYEKRPLAFPLGGVSFEGDYAIFNMRENCTRAKEFARQLFSEYRDRLSAEEALDAPDVTVEDQPATKYQALCGLEATVSTCPQADELYPD